MQIEFHYDGESRTKSLLKQCTMDDILSTFLVLFELNKANTNDGDGDGEHNFGLNLVTVDGLTALETPSQQLYNGAVIDIQRLTSNANSSDNDNDKDRISCDVKQEAKSVPNHDCSDTEDHKQEVCNPNDEGEDADADADDKTPEHQDKDKDKDKDKENRNDNENTNDDKKEKEKETDDKKEQTNATTKEKSTRFVVRLRGLPWSAREKEIIEFFAEESIEEVQIVFLTDGRASGEALVEFGDVKSFQTAFLKNRHHIGHRYIEIFKSTQMEIDTAAGRAVRPPARPPKSQFVIRMRGLPYSATDEDVCEFFNIPKPTQIHLIKDDLGRPSGEGFVEFKTEVDAIAAMAKHRHHMGHRYIELFRSSPEELMRALGLTTGWYNNRNGGPQPKSTCILMRGLPYSCTESDITKFFQEIDVTPIRIHRKADGAEAYVEFYSISDTDKAMTRHRNYIGRRYIELFRVTYEDMARTVGLPVTNTNIPASALSLNPSLISQQQMIPTSSMIGATAIMSAPLFADTMMNTMKQNTATVPSSATNCAAAQVAVAITSNTPSISSSATAATSHHPAHSYCTPHHHPHAYQSHNHAHHSTHNHTHHYPSAHASHYAPSASSHSTNPLLLSAANINALMSNLNTPNTQAQHVHYATPHVQHSSQPMLNNHYSQRASHQPSYYRHSQPPYYQ